MLSTKISFQSSLGHEELPALLEELENVFVRKLDDVDKVEIVQNSNREFDAIFYGKEKPVLDIQDVNMALFDVGLTGFII